MPHLCGKMRRLTSKDMSKKKKIQEEVAPDFHIISIKNPLSENASATRRNSHNNQTAAPIFSHAPSVVVSPSPVFGGSSNPASSTEAELAFLAGRFRSDIQKSMGSLMFPSNNTNNHSLQNNAFQNNAFQSNKLDMVALRQMFAPKPTANDAALLKRQMLASLLAQTDMGKLLSLAVANNGAW